MHAGLFDMAVDRVAESVDALADVWQNVEKKYRRAVAACMKPKLPLTLCTIYNGCLPDKAFQRLASTALMVFNDVIMRVGIELGLTIIDLRLVCALPEDYVNPIEPSSVGGAKIARCIVSSVAASQMERSGSRILIG